MNIQAYSAIKTHQNKYQITKNTASLVPTFTGIKPDIVLQNSNSFFKAKGLFDSIFSKFRKNKQYMNKKQLEKSAYIYNNGNNIR